MKKEELIKKYAPNENLLDNWLQKISRYNLLTEEETAILLQKIKKGDENALEKVVKAHLRLTISALNIYQNQGIGLIELINIAISGLIDATKEFDYSQNDKFIRFAVGFMRNRIEKAIEEKKLNK